MSEVDQAGMVSAEGTGMASAMAAVQSPPKVKVVERLEEDRKQELAQLAAEVAKRGSRRLMWEYLRLRSKVVGK